MSYLNFCAVNKIKTTGDRSPAHEKVRLPQPAPSTKTARTPKATLVWGMSVALGVQAALVKDKKADGVQKRKGVARGASGHVTLTALCAVNVTRPCLDILVRKRSESTSRGQKIKIAPPYSPTPKILNKYVTYEVKYAKIMK